MKPLSELSTLKYENLFLKGQNINAQIAQLQGQLQLLAKDAKLEMTAMRIEAGAGPEDEYDLKAKKFISKPKTLPPAGPKAVKKK